MGVSTFIWNAIVISIVELVYMIGVLFTIGFILGLMEKQSNRYLTQAFGKHGRLITAWIGIPIHELGHWIQCKIWRHQVESVKLLQINDPDGILGFVEHKYNPKSLYQQIGNFFIGIGPIISGISTIILAMYLLVPQSFTTFHQQIVQTASSGQQLNIHLFQTLGEAVLTMSKSLFTIENFTEPLFWIFMIISISVSSHIALSRADIQNSFQGLLTIFSILLLINFVVGLFGIDTYQITIKFTEYNAYLLAFSSIAVLFSLISLMLSFFLYKLTRS